MRRFPNILENWRAGTFQLFVSMHLTLNLFTKLVDSRVDLAPWVKQCLFIERSDHFGNSRYLQQTRAGRNQQADGELDRRDAFDEIVFADHFEEVAVAFERRPWREGHKRRLQHQTGVAKHLDCAQEIRASVMLTEHFEDSIIYRFDSASHEQAARVAQRHQVTRLL